MADPTLALQAAIQARLAGAAAVTAAAPGGIHDRPPTSYPGPYLVVGEDQVIEAGADCIDGVEVWITLHGWSEEPGMPALKALAKAVAECLHDAPLTLDGYRVVLIEHDGTRYLRHTDGLSSHAVITLRALIDAA